MNAATSPDAGRKEGEALKRTKTGLVETHKRAWTRRIQRAMLARLIDAGRATTDDIRDAADVPPDAGNAVWGAATQGLVKARLIRPVAFVTSGRPSRHGCPIRTWELAVDHGGAADWLDRHPELPEPEPDPEPALPGAARTHQRELF